jgi:hypothetical protein
MITYGLRLPEFSASSPLRVLSGWATFSEKVWDLSLEVEGVNPAPVRVSPKRFEKVRYESPCDEHFYVGYRSGYDCGK